MRKNASRLLGKNQPQFRYVCYLHDLRSQHALLFCDVLIRLSASVARRPAVQSSELGLMLRSLGYTPTEKEVADMAKDVGACFDCDAFLKCAALAKNRTPGADDLLEALKAFDKVLMRQACAPFTDIPVLSSS